MAQKDKIYFTTSWDDGSVQDLRLAELLTKYGIKGTFYIPVNFVARGSKLSEYKRRLSDKEIFELSKYHEIGAHTVNHKILSALSDFEVMQELVGSKEILEKIIGKRIKMFCFPRGDYNERTVELVKEAGFIGARTEEKLSFTLPKDQFEMKVSIHVAPFPLRKKDASSYYYARILDPIKSYMPKIVSMLLVWPKLFSWKMFSNGMYDYSVTNGNYFHLYGHSWELEKYGMWQELESFLKFVKEHKNVMYLSNSEIIENVVDN